jgi:hypothetical protein
MFPNERLLKEEMEEEEQQPQEFDMLQPIGSADDWPQCDLEQQYLPVLWGMLFDEDETKLPSLSEDTYSMQDFMAAPFSSDGDLNRYSMDSSDAYSFDAFPGPPYASPLPAPGFSYSPGTPYTVEGQSRANCNVPSCLNVAHEAGFCLFHSIKGAMCQQSECYRVPSGGHSLCQTHSPRATCGFAGCTKSTHGGKKCSAHGGRRECKVEACTRVDRGRGLCGAHGGKKTFPQSK